MQNGYKFWHLICISFCFILYVPEFQYCLFLTSTDGPGKEYICSFHVVKRVLAIIFS